MYGLSGVTALAYEVLWMRPVTLLFGVGNFGVVITVAAFMAGLGVGSLLGARISCSPRRALMLSALIESSLAIFALLLPTLLPLIDQRLVVYGATITLAEWQLLEAVLSFVLLLLPATAMGMVFPLLLIAARSCNLSVALLYGCNAVGGVVGALLPLLLLPWVGWSSALYLLLLSGLLLSAALALLATEVTDEVEQGSPALSSHSPPLLDLLSYAAVGAAALMIEIGWVRMFGMVLLRTEYLLALVLALMLAGIGGGSLLAHLWQTERLFRALPWLAAVGVLATLVAWPWLGLWVDGVRVDSLGEAIVVQGALVALLTLPTTLAFGAWLPLLSQRFAAVNGSGHGSASWLYGANSLGAATGAVIAGMVLMPWVGTPATLVVAALLLLLAALRWSGAQPLRFGG
ncbi:MAG: spermine synthase, partial [Mariprofundales bacterium]|nr:spermine synthase [Mariprofundales bacterium]